MTVKGSRGLGILYGVLVLPAMFLAVSSVFVFDAPGSERSVLTALFAISLAVLPFAFLLSAIGGIVCSFGPRSTGKLYAGRVFAWLPIVDVGVFLLVFVLLQTLCGGRFDCRV